MVLTLKLVDDCECCFCVWKYISLVWICTCIFYHKWIESKRNVLHWLLFIPLSHLLASLYSNSFCLCSSRISFKIVSTSFLNLIIAIFEAIITKITILFRKYRSRLKKLGISRELGNHISCILNHLLPSYCMLKME